MRIEVNFSFNDEAEYIDWMQRTYGGGKKPPVSAPEQKIVQAVNHPPRAAESAPAIIRGQDIPAPDMSVAQAAAATATAALPKPPTPAVVRVLEDLSIPEEEWTKIERTGKGGAMTQGDVKAYAKTRPLMTVEGASTPAGPRPFPVEAVESAQAQAGDPNHGEASAATAGDPNHGEAPAATIDDCQAVIKELHDLAGVGACISALKLYGAVRIRDMDPSKYGAFAGHCRKLIAEQTAEDPTAAPEKELY